jgi:regulatory protein
MLQEITAIKVQKKNRRRVNVCLDGEYAFALPTSIAASLKVGQTLSPAEIDELQECDAIEVAYDQALNYLSYRPRSRAEVEAYLKRKNTPPSPGRAVIDRLLEAALLDDEAFAQYWVENREQFRPRGLRSLRFELRQKGVADALIDEATAGIDETDSAYRAAHERARRLLHLDYQVFRRRLSGFLQRRGFGYDVVKETVDRVWREAQGCREEDPL